MLEFVCQVIKWVLGHSAKVYYQMQRAGIIPDRLVYPSATIAWGNPSYLQASKKVYEITIAKGFEFGIFVGTVLMSM